MTARDRQGPARTHARTQRCRVYENVNPDPEGATGARYTSRAIRPPLFHIASNFPPALSLSLHQRCLRRVIRSRSAPDLRHRHDDRSCLTNYRTIRPADFIANC